MIYMGAASLCWILCLGSASRVPENITCSLGDDVKFKCEGVKNSDFMVVKWTKSDLKDKYVFLQVDSHVESENQHPSFKNRVELLIGDGKVSLNLKNVKTDDAGTYECLVKTQTRRKKRANLEPISTINLSVVAPPGPTGGTTEEEVSRGRFPVIAGVFVFVMFLLFVVSVNVISKTQKKEKSPLPAPPDKEVEQLV